jgi:phage tail protein X
MKTIRMVRDFAYRAKFFVVVQYVAGKTYERVPEAAVKAILAANAGEIVEGKTVERPVI